jgi:hypothetical protein
MASIFELEDPNFGRLTKERTVKAGADEATTLTAAECIESIVTVTPTAARTYTTATAALILSELGANNKVGQTFELVVVNLAGATYAVTVAGGTGVTVTGAAAVSAATSGRFIGRVASSTTVVLYRA